MRKEDFLKLFGMGFLVADRTGENETASPLTIMNHYTGNDPDFLPRMLRYHWVEERVPNFIKLVWAHHRYLFFEPGAPLN
jgi:hypothetical protein